MAARLRANQIVLARTMYSGKDQKTKPPEFGCREAARILVSRGAFLLIGYHPFCLLNGLTKHFHRAVGEAIMIECHVHLPSEHFEARLNVGFRLREFKECVIDEAWLEAKPKWRPYLNWPVSFVFAWRNGTSR